MNLIGKAADAAFWAQVREKACYETYRNELHTLWDRFGDAVPLYALTYCDFRRFFRDGNRSVYEKAYFAHRQSMNASAILAMIYPEEPRYLERLMDSIYVICDEYTWCLPAHQPGLDEKNDTHIDLFAAETGFALAEITTMLGERLEPLIRNRVRAEIDRRIVDSFRNKHFGWEDGTSNWTAVCMGSVGCAIMLTHPELVPEFRPRFDRSMELFLSGFSREGMCLEGCGYWHYGFGFFTVYADMLRTFTNGEVDYFKRDHVRTVAAFIQKMFLSGASCVSFADGGQKLSYHLGLVHYLKKEYPEDVVVYSPALSYNYDLCARWCLHLRAATWLEEDWYWNTADNQPAEYFAPDAGWYVKRTAAYGFCAKGGNNDEHHNHNDVGSFVFAKNGRQLLMDLGPSVYTRQYFAADTRYGILECSSRGHNVPLIDGVCQSFGKQYAATGTMGGNGVFTTDLAGAYGIPALTSLHRTFLCGEDTVTLTDTYEYSGSGVLTERLVTLIEPTVDETSATVTVGDATVTYDPAACTVAVYTETRIHGDTCYLIDFTLREGLRAFTVTIR